MTTDTSVLEGIKVLKKRLCEEGFIIDGIFGSVARGDATENSDVDILYHLEPKFYTTYDGFSGFKKLDEIKQLIGSTLNRKIDLAPASNLSKTARKYIYEDLICV